jgi:ergothioneine biosynthesis protein EgtB
MERSQLVSLFREVRRVTEWLCRPLEVEDYVIQPVIDVSPPKWHLAHTSWFFETLVLQRYDRHYAPYHPLYSFLFNSYYESLGKRVDRARRGSFSRPTVKETYDYRSYVTGRICEVINVVEEAHWPELCGLVVLGLNHEQQHQELLVTDIKYILVENPLQPPYWNGNDEPSPMQTDHQAPVGAEYVPFEGGSYEVGWRGDGFCFDNEQPAHEVCINAFRLLNRPVTNAEWLEFILDGGYRDFRLWLSDGWDLVQREDWAAPLYWKRLDGRWFEATLSGVRELAPHAPVCHVSYYEAAAFACWAKRRLPTEIEWEVAAGLTGAGPSGGNFLEDCRFHPVPVETRPEETDVRLFQLFGDVWEWTASAYLPYPGYPRSEGPLGEYNAKFMVNQMVLRGGSCATPRTHIRLTYRNFFQPEKRWQFTGLRLADGA